jgi:hypothetical protein
MCSKYKHNKLLRNYGFALPNINLPTNEETFFTCLKEQLRQANNWIIHFDKMILISNKPRDTFLDGFKNEIRYLRKYTENDILYRLTFNNHHQKLMLRQHLRNLVAKNMALHSFGEDDEYL